MKAKYFLILVAPVFLFTCQPIRKEKSTFRSLFNGKDLQGWETYIGIPDSAYQVPGLSRDESGRYGEPVGLNKDPLHVFSVVEADGEPAVRVTGQINGALGTTEEFGNYHFRMQMKWGEKKWSPNRDRPRNSGLLYHGTGEYGAGLGVWKNSHECQLMESMFGDSYRMGDTYCRIRADKPDENGSYVYTPEAEEVDFGAGKTGGKLCSKNAGAEKPAGEWNTIEVICSGDTSIHIINGVVNMILAGSHLETSGEIIPLTKGTIQLQSEGAEVYFRKMEIRSIDKIPEEFRP